MWNCLSKLCSSSADVDYSSKAPSFQPIKKLTTELIKIVGSYLPLKEFLELRQLDKQFKDLTYFDWFTFSGRVNVPLFKKYCEKIKKPANQELIAKAVQCKVLECFSENNHLEIEELDYMFEKCSFTNVTELRLSLPEKREEEEKSRNDQFVSLIKKIRSSCPKLKEIVVKDFPNLLIQTLMKELENLSRLTLTNQFSEIRKETVTCLNSHKNLEEISIGTNHSLRISDGMLRLKTLQYAGKSSDRFQSIIQFSELTTLSLIGFELDESEFISTIPHLKNLRLLELYNCSKLTCDVFQVFPKLLNLRKLHINGLCGRWQRYRKKYVRLVTPKQMAHLLECRELTHVSIYDNLDDDNLIVLTQIKKLTQLILGRSNFTLTGLSSIKKCEHLETLSFSIDSAKNLEEIFLEITKCRTLRFVDISHFNSSTLFQRKIGKILTQYPYLNIYLPKVKVVFLE